MLPLFRSKLCGNPTARISAYAVKSYVCVLCFFRSFSFYSSVQCFLWLSIWLPFLSRSSSKRLLRLFFPSQNSISLSSLFSSVLFFFQLMCWQTWFLILLPFKFCVVKSSIFACVRLPIEPVKYSVSCYFFQYFSFFSFCFPSLQLQGVYCFSACLTHTSRYRFGKTPKSKRLLFPCNKGLYLHNNNPPHFLLAAKQPSNQEWVFRYFFLSHCFVRWFFASTLPSETKTC